MAIPPSRPRKTHKLTVHWQSEMDDGTQSCPSGPPPPRGRVVPRLQGPEIIQIEPVATQLAAHLQLLQLYLQVSKLAGWLRFRFGSPVAKFCRRCLPWWSRNSDPRVYSVACATTDSPVAVANVRISIISLLYNIIQLQSWATSELIDEAVSFMAKMARKRFKLQLESSVYLTFLAVQKKLPSMVHTVLHLRCSSLWSPASSLRWQ